MPKNEDFEPILSFKEVSSAASTDSQAVDLHGTIPVGLQWTPDIGSSTTLKFLVSFDGLAGSDFEVLTDGDGNDISKTIDGSGGKMKLDPTDFACVRFLKVQTDSSETATFTLALRPVG